MTELPPSRVGMFGVAGSGDTSGFGGPVRPAHQVPSTPRPYGGWFDAAYDALARAYPALSDAVERVVVEHEELTVHLRREHLVEICQVLRDDPALRFEVCSSVSGVDYLGAAAGPDPDSGRLHVVYELLSMSFRRRIRLEVAVSVADPAIPSVTSVWPTANWHEREAFDFFGFAFTGHPGLARILMPDEWQGHPQRKDYPLGGVPVEYKGAKIPPPNERRSYT